MFHSLDNQSRASHQSSLPRKSRKSSGRALATRAYNLAFRRISGHVDIPGKRAHRLDCMHFKNFFVTWISLQHRAALLSSETASGGGGAGLCSAASKPDKMSAIRPHPGSSKGSREHSEASMHCVNAMSSCKSSQHGCSTSSSSSCPVAGGVTVGEVSAKTADKVELVVAGAGRQMDPPSSQTHPSNVSGGESILPRGVVSHDVIGTVPMLLLDSISL